MSYTGRVLVVVLLSIFLSLSSSHGKRGVGQGAGYASYVVRRGDTLSSIARRYHISWKKLARINGISPPYKIFKGQRLRVPLLRGGYRLYRVKRGDFLKRIARRYGVSWRTLARLNGIKRPYTIYRGQYLKVPRSGAPFSRGKGKVKKAVSLRRSLAWVGDFIPPVPSKAQRGINMGLDYPLTKGEKIIPSAPGKVVYASLDMRGLGSVLILEHSGGYETVYAGKAIYWTVGEGEEIGKDKMLGEAVEETVLHFEIRRAGRPLPAAKLVGRRTKGGKK